MKSCIEFYTDQELDSESNLYNYDARLYDPVIGRFISIDPVIPNIYDPQYLSPYTYCRNNPLIYIDPSGESPDLAMALYYQQQLWMWYLMGGVESGRPKPQLPQMPDLGLSWEAGMNRIENFFASMFGEEKEDKDVDGGAVSGAENANAGASGMDPDGDKNKKKTKSDDQKRAEHAKAKHKEWNDVSVDDLVDVQKNIRQFGTKYRAGNGNTIIRKGKAILIEDKFAADKGTVFIKNESSKKILRYIDKFLRQNR